MHMADALISPAVGGAMWAVTAGLTAHCARRVRRDEFAERKVPLMGVLGAFVFAAQMINFAIPGTGSSGHLGGGLLLAVLLGPAAGFLTTASVLTVQALFFADGGLLALGCNVFNLGFFPCFIAYPLIYRSIVCSKPAQGRMFAAAMLAGIAGLQLGAFSVVLETLLSGLSTLPFASFVLLMQPIHLAIGIVEGLVTAAVVSFVWKARPELFQPHLTPGVAHRAGLGRIVAALLLAAAALGGGLSWFASTHPDGLEWAIGRTSGNEEPASPDTGIHSSLASVQEKTAVLPDYDFAGSREGEERWPAIRAGTSVSGLLGGAITLALAGLLGVALGRRRRGASAHHGTS